MRAKLVRSAALLLFALALIWLIGSYAIVFGVLMLILAFRLRGVRDTLRRVSGAV